MLLFWIISMVTPLVCEAQTAAVPCQDSRCVNATTSVCRVAANGGQICQCTPGYSGEHCSEDLDECTSGKTNPCGNRGNCLNTVGSYRCLCLRGWTGGHCETSSSSGDHECLPGWTGTRCWDDVDECQLPDNPCDEGTCTNTPGSFTCQDAGKKLGLIIGASVAGVVVVGVVVAVTAYLLVVRNRQKAGVMKDIVEAMEAAGNTTHDDL